MFVELSEVESEERLNYELKLCRQSQFSDLLSIKSLLTRVEYFPDALDVVSVVLEVLRHRREVARHFSEVGMQVKDTRRLRAAARQKRSSAWSAQCDLEMTKIKTGLHDQRLSSVYLQSAFPSNYIYIYYSV